MAARNNANSNNNYKGRPVLPMAGAQLRGVPDPDRLKFARSPNRTNSLVESLAASPRPDLAKRSRDEWYLYFLGIGLQDIAAINALSDKFIKALSAQFKPLRTARGAMGKVLVLDNNAAVREALDRLRDKAAANGNFVAGEPRMTAKALAVKVQPIFRARRFTTVGERMREDAVHAYLTLAGCRTGPDGARWCARDAVPSLHWAGYLPSANVQVSVMEAVEGPELYDVAQNASREELRRLHAALEHATFTLWAFGIFHADLHPGNVIVQPDGRLKIIDFGFAIALNALASPLSVARMRSARVHARLETEADEVMRRRGYASYNPNTQQLLRAWHDARPTTPDAATPMNIDDVHGRSLASPDLRGDPAAESAARAADELIVVAASMIVGTREDAGKGRFGREDSEVLRGEDDYGRIVSTADARGAWSVRVIAFASGGGSHRADFTLSGTAKSLTCKLSPGASQLDTAIARKILGNLRSGRVNGAPIGRMNWRLQMY